MTDAAFAAVGKPAAAPAFGLTTLLIQTNLECDHLDFPKPEEAEMKLPIALSALLITGFVAASTEKARAVVYCHTGEYAAGCVPRPGFVVAPTPDVRKIPPSIGAATSGFILRQDLFDRNNPNNLRSDWRGPPAQPGQF